MHDAYAAIGPSDAGNNRGMALTPEEIAALAAAPQRIENDRQITVERSFYDLREGAKLARAVRRTSNPWLRVSRAVFVLGGSSQQIPIDPNLPDQ